MKKGGKGGGRTISGLHYEKRVDIVTLLSKIKGYEIKSIHKKAGKGVFYNDKLIARTFKQHEFYKFLDEEGVNWKNIVSKKLLPDDSLLIIVRDTLFIIEVKFQAVEGSVDEKLQTCDFKRKQYSKLVKELGLRIEYIYVLNDWFKKPKYKDTLDYIESVMCHYRFNTIPLKWLGLPDDE